jgi:hypothetical protein
MAEPLLSKKLLCELEEHLSGWATLRKIKQFFDAAEIAPDTSHRSTATGQRRALVEQYFHRLNLTDPGDVKKLLRVFEQVLHDLVEKSESSVQGEAPMAEHARLLRWLKRDGYTLEDERIVVIGRSRMLEELGRVSEPFDAPHLRQQIRRMQDSVDSDPWLAIGTAKELVETTCKTILEARGRTTEPGWELGRLLKETRNELKLAPDDIPETAKAADTIKRMLSNLATIAQGLAELRNPYGTGHGPAGAAKGLQPRHARLATGAAAVLATFLFETHEARSDTA